MEQVSDFDVIRRKATAYLQDLLQNAINTGGSTQQAAIDITDLAFDNDNPVKEFFAVAQRQCTPAVQVSDIKQSPAPQASETSSGILPNGQASPERSLKSRGSRGLLRLGRLGNKGASSEGKTPSQASNGPQGPSLPTPDSSTSGKGTSKAAAMISSFPAVQRSVKASGPSQFRCIVCSENLSSKGVCKRHLEDQHVSPKMFECEKCQERFTVKADVKKHCNGCGGGVLLYVVVKPEAKRVYVSAYTGETFSSMAKYLDHLLMLSEKTDDRPTCDLHLALRALLDQPSIHHHVADTSNKIYGSSHCWRNLQWSESALSKAIEQLEYATVRDDGHIEFGRHADYKKTRPVKIFLESLLCAGKMNANQEGPTSHQQETVSMAQTRRASTSSVSSDRTMTPAPSGTASTIDSQSVAGSVASLPLSTTSSTATTIAQTPSTDTKGKRHLSDQSRAFVPVRHPPGPPQMPMNVPQMYEPPTHGSHPSMHSNASMTSLPYRHQGSPMPGQESTATSIIERPFQDLTCMQQNRVPSDAASESTLFSNYQEPQFLESSGYDYNPWDSQQNFNSYPFTFDSSINCSLPDAGYFLPGNASLRASSIATDQTYVVDYSEAEQKLANYDTVSLNPAPQNGTFLWDDNDDYGNDASRMR